MDFRELSYITAIAKYQNITKAAESLYISQPTLSKFLKALEEDKKVTFKNWGAFEKREMKVRKVLVPTWEKAQYIKPKEIVKFRAGKSLIEIANGDTDE